MAKSTKRAAEVINVITEDQYHRGVAAGTLRGVLFGTSLGIMVGWSLAHWLGSTPRNRKKKQ